MRDRIRTVNMLSYWTGDNDIMFYTHSLLSVQLNQIHYTLQKELPGIHRHRFPDPSQCSRFGRKKGISSRAAERTCPKPVQNLFFPGRFFSVFFFHIIFPPIGKSLQTFTICKCDLCNTTVGQRNYFTIFVCTATVLISLSYPLSFMGRLTKYSLHVPM